MSNRARPGADAVALRRLLWRWRWKVLAAFLAASASAVPVLYSTLAIGNAVDAVRRNDSSSLSHWTLILFGLAAAAIVLWGVRIWLTSRAAFAIEHDVRAEYFEKILNASPVELARHDVGQLVARGTADLRSVRTFFTGGLPGVAQLLTGFIFVLVQSGRTHPWLGVIAIAPVAGVMTAAWWRLRRDTGAMHAARNEFGAATTKIDETVRAMNVVRGYGRRNEMANEVDAHLRAGRSAMDRVFARNARFQAIITALPYIGLLVVLAVGARLAIEQNSVTGGNYVSIYLLLLMLVGPTASLGTVIMLGQQAGAVMGRVDEVMAWPDSPSTKVDPAVDAAVDFDSVSAGYEAAVFSDLSMRIEPGEKVAIAGAIGSGKSVAFRSLKGIVRPFRGTVRTSPGTTLMTNEDVFFEGTLWEVLTYGRPDATDEQVRAALRDACADGIVDGLPDGLDTKVGGKRGRSFSGGEHQRLVLARALLTEPDVLAADGATVGLDPQTQSMVLSNLMARADTTVIIDGGQRANLGAVDRIITIGRDGVIDDRRTQHTERAETPEINAVDLRGIDLSVVENASSETSSSSNVDNLLVTNEHAAAMPVAPSTIPTARERRKRMAKARRKVLVELLRPDSRAIAVAVVVVVVATAATLGPAFFGYRMVDDVLGARSLERLDRLTILLGGSVVLAAIGVLLEGTLVPRLGNRFLRRLRMRAFRSLLDAPNTYLRTQDPGRLLSQLTNNIELLASLVLNAGTIIISSAALLIGMAIVFLLINAKLAVIAFIAMPAVVFGAWVMSKARRWATSRNVAGIGDLTAFLRETIDGSATMHAYGRTDWHREKFGRLNDEEVRALWRASWTFGAFAMYADFVVALSIAFVVMIGGHDALGGALAVSTLVVFTTYLTTGIVPISTLATMQASYGQSSIAFDQLVALIGIHPDADGAITPSRSVGNGAVIDLNPGESHARPVALRFNDVWFAFDNRGWVLRRLKFHVDDGEHVMVVGDSGAGKTSLLDLILRFNRPLRGTVEVGGVDVATVTDDWLRTQIAFVPQEPFVFSGSLLENVRFGRPAATRAEVERVLADLGVTSSILAGMGGLDRVVASGGPELGAGERQLLACARALLADRPILLLDEATSVLEPQLAGVVEAAFSKLRNGRTTVTVAHRVATRPDVDRIVVVSDHHIVESGTHEELLAAGGRYSNWWKLSASN